MASSDRGTVVSIAVVVVGAAAALFGQAAWRAWPPEDAVEFLSAISTTAAAVIALWLGLRDGQRRRADERDRAGLGAAGVLVRLEHLTGTVRQLDATMDFIDDINYTPSEVSRMANELQRGLAGIDLHQFEALIALPNRCAHRLVRAVSLAAWVQGEMERFVNTRDNAGLRRVVPPIGIRIWKRDIWKAKDLLMVAIEDCRAAAKLSAPDPTHEELYGDMA